MTRRLVALQIRVQPAIERRIKRAMDRDHGATAVEYGLMVALIAAVIVGTVKILGGKVNAAFTAVNAVLPG